MNKTFIRLISLVLIPCLIADTVTASILASPTQIKIDGRHSPTSQLFDEQAISAYSIVSRHIEFLHGALGKISTNLSSLLIGSPTDQRGSFSWRGRRINGKENLSRTNNSSNKIVPLYEHGGPQGITLELHGWVPWERFPKRGETSFAGVILDHGREIGFLSGKQTAIAVELEKYELQPSVVRANINLAVVNGLVSIAHEGNGRALIGAYRYLLQNASTNLIQRDLTGKSFALIPEDEIHKLIVSKIASGGAIALDMGTPLDKQLTDAHSPERLAKRMLDGFTNPSPEAYAGLVRRLGHPNFMSDLRKGLSVLSVMFKVLEASDDQRMTNLLDFLKGCYFVVFIDHDLDFAYNVTLHSGYMKKLFHGRPWPRIDMTLDLLCFIAEKIRPDLLLFLDQNPNRQLLGDLIAGFRHEKGHLTRFPKGSEAIFGHPYSDEEEFTRLILLRGEYLNHVRDSYRENLSGLTWEEVFDRLWRLIRYDTVSSVELYVAEIFPYIPLNFGSLFGNEDPTAVYRRIAPTLKNNAPFAIQVATSESRRTSVLIYPESQASFADRALTYKAILMELGLYLVFALVAFLPSAGHLGYFPASMGSGLMGLIAVSAFVGMVRSGIGANSYRKSDMPDQFRIRLRQFVTNNQASLLDTFERALSRLSPKTFVVPSQTFVTAVQREIMMKHPDHDLLKRRDRRKLDKLTALYHGLVEELIDLPGAKQLIKAWKHKRSEAPPETEQSSSATGDKPLGMMPWLGKEILKLTRKWGWPDNIAVFITSFLEVSCLGAGYTIVLTGVLRSYFPGYSLLNAVIFSSCVSLGLFVLSHLWSPLFYRNKDTRELELRDPSLKDWNVLMGWGIIFRAVCGVALLLVYRFDNTIGAMFFWPFVAEFGVHFIRNLMTNGPLAMPGSRDNPSRSASATQDPEGFSELPAEIKAKAMMWDLRNLHRQVFVSFKLGKPLEKDSALAQINRIQTILGFPALSPETPITGEESQELQRSIDALERDKSTPEPLKSKKAQRLLDNRLSVQMRLAAKLIRSDETAAALATLWGTMGGLKQKSRRPKGQGFPDLPIRNGFGELLPGPLEPGSHIIDLDERVWARRQSQFKKINIGQGDKRILDVPIWFAIEDPDATERSFDYILESELSLSRGAIARVAKQEIAQRLLRGGPTPVEIIEIKKIIGAGIEYAHEGVSIGRSQAEVDLRGALVSMRGGSFELASRLIELAKVQWRGTRLAEIQSILRGVKIQQSKFSGLRLAHDQLASDLRQMVETIPSTLPERIAWCEKLKSILERPLFHGPFRQLVTMREQFNNVLLLLDPAEALRVHEEDADRHFNAAAQKLAAIADSLQNNTRYSRSAETLRTTAKFLTQRDLLVLDKDLKRDIKGIRSRRGGKSLADLVARASWELDKPYLGPLEVSDYVRRKIAAKQILDGLWKKLQDQKIKADIETSLEGAMLELNAADLVSLDRASARSTQGTIASEEEIRNAFETIRRGVLNVLDHPSGPGPAPTRETPAKSKKDDIFDPVFHPHKWSWHVKVPYYLAVAGWETYVFNYLALRKMPEWLQATGFHWTQAWGAAFFIAGPIFVFSHTIIRWIVTKNADKWKGWGQELRQEFLTPAALSPLLYILPFILLRSHPAVALAVSIASHFTRDLYADREGDILRMIDAYLRGDSNAKDNIEKMGFHIYPITQDLNQAIPFESTSNEGIELVHLAEKAGFRGSIVYVRAPFNNSQTIEVPVAGPTAIRTIAHELAGNILNHAHSKGVILTRQIDNNIEIMARDLGVGMNSLPWSMDPLMTSLPISGEMSGIGLPQARDLAISGGDGEFTIASNGLEIHYDLSIQTSNPVSSVVKLGSFVYVTRHAPAPTITPPRAVSGKTPDRFSRTSA